MITTETTADLYRRLAAALTERVDAVPADRWENPSPCDGWTTRDVLAHIVDTQTQMIGVVGLSVPDGPAVATDPAAAWRHTRDAVQAILDDPATAGLEYDGHFGRTDLASTFRTFYCFDLVVHGWDIARAAGLDDTIPDRDLDLLDAVIAQLGESLHTDGVCGPALDTPADADRPTRILAALRRRA
ncbi:TIGR03086 family metal-binding protein [Rhodococcus sp. SGAir0479]|uniref:TIGR03086 family metal-binding protein n=1 Tax=Rhodococcus sp. SGAir0479 TaxID=2567884 RepID=UPI0010CD11AC|nr:TIGR03086 family metal-binding protein [Rhodococcus sp. SGAir0479]QCQ93313.1 TIGR03086 family protein [Rhodococcus sp. SGAir0479]